MTMVRDGIDIVHIDIEDDHLLDHVLGRGVRLGDDMTKIAMIAGTAREGIAATTPADRAHHPDGTEMIATRMTDDGRIPAHVAQALRARVRARHTSADETDQAEKPDALPAVTAVIASHIHPHQRTRTKRMRKLSARRSLQQCSPARPSLSRTAKPGWRISSPKKRSNARRTIRSARRRASLLAACGLRRRVWTLRGDCTTGEGGWRRTSVLLRLLR